MNTLRQPYNELSPEVYNALVQAKIALEKSELDGALIELVYLRVSQINGCAFCVDMHTSDARKAGETERRLYAVSVWRETPFFTARERAVLAWTEALTLLPQSQAPDDVYAALAQQLTPAEMVNVTLAIGSINTWNRLAVGFRKMPE